MIVTMKPVPYPEGLLHLGDALDEDGPQLVPYAGQQEAEQGDPEDGVQDAEDLPPLGAGRDVAVP